MYTVEIKHNFETAHRLSSPDAPIKCQSIHGHSWWVTVQIAGDVVNTEGMLVEFGAFKRAWRGFLDDRLDHHLVVRTGDVVAAAILGVQPDARIAELPFDPTTENLACYLHQEAVRILATLDTADGVRIRAVHLQETTVNAASWQEQS